MTFAISLRPAKKQSMDFKVFSNPKQHVVESHSIDGMTTVLGKGSESDSCSKRRC